MPLTSGFDSRVVLGQRIQTPPASAQARIFGKTSAASPNPQHLELVVRQGPKGRESFLRIQWWGGAAHAEHFPKGTAIDAVVEVGLSTFSRLAEVEAKLVDIRHAVSSIVEVPA